MKMFREPRCDFEQVTSDKKKKYLMGYWVSKTIFVQHSEKLFNIFNRSNENTRETSCVKHPIKSMDMNQFNRQ